MPRSQQEERALCGILVHWYDEGGALRLIEDWPSDPRFELLVIDNGSQRRLDVPPEVELLEPGHNLGFAGAINLGLRHTAADCVLILNSDLRIQVGALEALLEGFAAHPDAAGLAPRLVGEDGTSQHRWQLRPIPSRLTLALHALWLAAGTGPAEEPAAGTIVEQPAAAALALDRETLTRLGGFDERFFPAWFEDVDLGARLLEAGHRIRYWPDAAFVHIQGASVRTLGYGSFLRIYYTNLCRYLAKHHGAGWAVAVRPLLSVTALLRLLLLPVRKPRRARNRGEAALGLLRLAGWSLTGRPDPLPAIPQTAESRRFGAAARRSGADSTPRRSKRPGERAGSIS